MRTIGGNETKRNILIDANNLFYRAYFAFVQERVKNGLRPLTAKLSTVSGSQSVMDVGVIQGSLKILSSWLHDIQTPSKIIVFFDGLPSRRTSVFPDYKKRDKDDMKQSVHLESDVEDPFLLRDGTKVFGPISAMSHLFRLLGCDVYHHPGEEADDLIATFVRRNLDNVNIIISSDKDFFQLVGGRTVVYRPGPKSPRIHDAERVAECMNGLYKVPVTPSQIRMFKALTGDLSDGITGIYGLRKKVAAPMCNYSSVKEVYESGLPGFSDMERAKAIASRPQIELNYDLVGFFDQLDIDSCLQSEIGDFVTASHILREDMSFIDVDLLPFRVGRHTVRPIQSVPDWLADI